MQEELYTLHRKIILKHMEYRNHYQEYMDMKADNPRLLLNNNEGEDDDEYEEGSEELSQTYSDESYDN